MCTEWLDVRLFEVIDVRLGQHVSSLNVRIIVFFGLYAMVWTDKGVYENVAYGCLVVAQCHAQDGGFLPPSSVGSDESCHAGLWKLSQECIGVEGVR